MPTHILGISAFYHDSAAALLRDGEIVAAAQEERFTRRKADARFPINAVKYCLREAGISVKDLTYVSFYDDPKLKFKRIVQTYLGLAPRGLESFLSAAPLWLTDKMFAERNIRQPLQYTGPLLYPEHHDSHAASAFYPSPFDDAAILTIDGVGEWATTSWGEGRGNEIRILREMRWPDSLGLLYSAFTAFTGFKINSGEYKVMGLAPYGEPRYSKLIYDNLMDLREDGSFRLNQKYFNYLTGMTMTNDAFADVFGGPARVPESDITQREMDLARSLQDVTEEIMLRMARTVHKETGHENLCLAGGVALNCVGNGRLLRESPFKRIWIQPAAGDAGGALGAAQLGWYRYLNNPRKTSGNGKDSMRGSYLGPSFPDAQIEEYLKKTGAQYEKLDRDTLLSRTADVLADEKIVGWLNGRMEFGPRSLGCRSILGDPRSPRMQADMNIKIKFREGFRPFAPSVLGERAADYFELDAESPYMLLVAPVRKERRLPMSDVTKNLWGIAKLNVPRSDIPAVTHIDYSARVQTVTPDTNPDYYGLLKAFEAKTGCATLVNTSFNVRGEPIVCTPEDAYRCFMRTHIDYLVLGSFLLTKTKQPEWKETSDWRSEFVLD